MLEVATRRADKLMVLTAAQVCSVAVCAALVLLVFELPRSNAGAASAYWDHIAASLRLHALNFTYLGIVCTAAIIALQTWGQRHSTANEAAVIYAFEPACAAFFAYFWLAEAMTPWGWVGAALLISGMIISQWRPASARSLASTSASASASASLAPK
jgi:drug/metabolite transporter (DMT)-like permease